MDSISHEGIRKPEKNELKPWQKKEWCIPEVSADFVASMEEVLDVDRSRFDESSTQLLSSGHRVYNLFMFIEPPQEGISVHTR